MTLDLAHPAAPPSRPAPQPMLVPFSERRFLFITGKGGVGKTTVAAALGLHLARRGRRVLLATSSVKEHLSTLFGRPALSPQIEPILPGLSALRLEPEAALSEYGTLHLRSRVVYGAVFQNRIVRAFFAGVPGLSEWAVLGKAWHHSVELAEDGRARFDTVVFDAPATGHGLDMLRVPRVILDVAPPGILRRDAEQAWQSFTDPAHTGVIVVSLPEELPTTETIELVAALRGDLGLPIGALVANAVLDELLRPEERRALRSIAGPDMAGSARDCLARDCLASAVRRATREDLQAENLARLERLRLPTVKLPLLLGNAESFAAVERLAAQFQTHECA